MSRHYILLSHGNIKSVSAEEASDWRNNNNATLWKDKASNDIRIETVFTTYNGEGTEQEPLLFETRIYGGNRDGYWSLYRTYEDAKFGHNALLTELSKSE